MISFKKIVYYISSFFLWMFFLLNVFSNKTYSLEVVYHSIGFLLKSNPLLTIFLFILIISSIIIWSKIFDDFHNWLKNHNFITHALSKYEYYHLTGDYDNALLALKSTSIWRHNKLFQYSIHQLAARIYLIEGKEKLCYQSIEKAFLFTQSAERKIELNKLKIQLYINSGSVNSAKELLDNLKNNLANSSYQTLSHFESLISEKQGLVEESISKLNSASHLIGNQNPQELFVIYNNLGRISGLLNNNNDEILFFEKAKAVITAESSKYQRHVIYQNLIGSLLRSGNNEKFSSLLSEYSYIIEKQNKHDLLEYNNFLLKLYRQTNDLSAFINVIDQMHVNLYPLLSKEEKLISNIHELKFCFNNIGIQLDLLNKIKNELSQYSQFDLREKLFAYQIIYQAITSPDGTQCLHPFEDMHNFIFNFFRNSFLEIDDYIKNRVVDFQINDKCWLLEKKVWLFNFQPHNKDNRHILIQQKLKLIDEITNIYSFSGNVILSIESKLNYVDECMGSLQNQLTMEQSQILKDQMLLSFEKVESEVQPFLKHPEMPPLLIRLSEYASYLGMKELTEKYYNMFSELRISTNHFAAWLQNYFIDVHNYLNSSSKLRE